MTKGWCRFVKEMKLESGDIVSFHRGYVPDDNEPEKRKNIFFIDWRPRANTSLVHNINYHHYPLLGSIIVPALEYELKNYKYSLYINLSKFKHTIFSQTHMFCNTHASPYI